MGYHDAAECSEIGGRPPATVKPQPWWSPLADACFGLLPRVPYARPDRADCLGIAVEAHGLSAAARTDGPTAFTAADFTIPCGCRTALIGPNGSGKSTLMHCMAGLDEMTQGSVTIADIDIASLKDKELTRLRRDKIGFVFQSFNLVPTLTADENIRLPLLLGNNKGNEEWIQKVINTVHLQDRLTHRPSELSGGQQQRVAVARALASEPAIIFADEPTGNLDSTTGTEILSFMRKAVNELGQTIVMVTHDPVSASYADRIVFLKDGKIAGELLEPTPELVLDYMKKLGH